MISWFNKITKTFMSRDYLKGRTIDQAIKEISDHAEAIMNKEGLSEKLQDYIKKGYYIIPTPCWSNFNNYSTQSAISCFGVYIEDSIESILDADSEVGTQSKVGGGTSGYFGELRARGSNISGGGKTNGPVSFMEMFQTTTGIVSQANRRGHFAATLPIEHPDILEFLQIRGDGHAIQHLSFAVSIGDEWMNDMINGDENKIKIWARILEVRFATGFPYIFFRDTVNANAPDVYKDKGISINNSNMCCEIALSNSKDESFVCDLLGMNIEKFDEWKNTDAIEIGLYLLDAMLQDFVTKNKSNKHMQRTVKFVENQMAVGIGASGYHSYLQSKMIPFESMEAELQNIIIFKTIQEQAIKASEKLALEYGKPHLLKEDKYKRRHVCLTAVAPNTSSSFIMNQQSQSIEPYVSNYYIKDVAKVRISLRNPYLERLLESKGKNNEDIWRSILVMDGSVQHLDFLSENEKSVFKTFKEINQLEVITQAAQRQKYIDQSQSLNIIIPEGTKAEDVSFLMLKAWKLGIKTLYYQLNVNVAQEFTNNIVRDECVSCAG